MSLHLQSVQAAMAHQDPLLSLPKAADVQALVASVFDYAPTPLVHLPALSANLGVGTITVKDEGARLGLKSFKALGGAYAVFQLALAHASQKAGYTLSIDELPSALSGSLDLPRGTRRAGSPRFQAAASEMVFACATDGNHGQSVAAGACLIGARAVIFVHQGVTPMRRAAIARFGAEIREVLGSYDDAVAMACQVAQQEGWTLLSDTTWPGYEDVPRWVMQGYTLIAAEVRQQLPEPPTHVFLQAGVGGFAAALCAAMQKAWPVAPRFVVVEPDRAACLFASARAGIPTALQPGQPTLMSMLECYEPSLLAWKILAPLVSAFMTVTEDAAVDAMRALAHPSSNDRAVVAGESGAAGLAGLMSAMREPSLAAALGLAPASKVLLVNTESATDEQRYEELVGVPPSAVGMSTAPTGA